MGLLESVVPVAKRVAAGKHRSSRWSAGRRVAHCAGERDAPGGQSINVGGFDVAKCAVAATADEVIVGGHRIGTLIVGDDPQNIGLPGDRRRILPEQNVEGKNK